VFTFHIVATAILLMNICNFVIKSTSVISFYYSLRTYSFRINLSCSFFVTNKWIHWSVSIEQSVLIVVVYYVYMNLWSILKLPTHYCLTYVNCECDQCSHCSSLHCLMLGSVSFSTRFYVELLLFPQNGIWFWALHPT